MLWTELGLKMTITMMSFAYIISQNEGVTFPITELSVAIIISAQFLMISNRPIFKALNPYETTKVSWLSHIDHRWLELLLVGEIIIAA